MLIVVGRNGAAFEAPIYFEELKMEMFKVPDKTLTRLPNELQVAQNAIETQEVQDIIKALAKYNLGVCMPHLHNARVGFDVLPNDIISVEENLITSFVSRSEAEADTHRLPTAWRCSGQVNLATVLEFNQYRLSDSFGVNPSL